MQQQTATHHKPFQIAIDKQHVSKLREELSKLGHVKMDPSQQRGTVYSEQDPKTALFSFEHDLTTHQITIHPLNVPADISPAQAEATIREHIQALLGQ